MIQSWLIGGLLAVWPLGGQDFVGSLLPPDAQVVETATIQTRGGRELVLWMEQPQKELSKGDTCPDFLYGDRWIGKTHLSLVNLATKKLVNTIEIDASQPSGLADDQFPIPFSVEGGVYSVEHPAKDGKGKPRILNLRDLTGEGVFGQFTLFEYMACGMAAGRVVGYSAATDRAMQYPIEVTQGRMSPVLHPSLASVFLYPPVRAGIWDVIWDPGHGADRMIHDRVRFDARRQMFEDHQTNQFYPDRFGFSCNFALQAAPQFFAAIGNVLSDRNSEFVWAQGRMFNEPPNQTGGAGLVPQFQGKTSLVDMTWVKTPRGQIELEMAVDVVPAAALKAPLSPWCTAQ